MAGWTKTRVSFHPDQGCDRRTQKPRSAGAIWGRRPFTANVASCWRRAISTIAWLLRLRKRAGIQQRKIVVSLSNCHITRRILHCADVNCETESWLRFGLSWLVDPSSAEGKRLTIPVRSGFENTQAPKPCWSRSSSVVVESGKEGLCKIRSLGTRSTPSRRVPDRRTPSTFLDTSRPARVAACAKIFR